MLNSYTFLVCRDDHAGDTEPIADAYWIDYDGTYTSGSFTHGNYTLHGKQSELAIEAQQRGQILTAGVTLGAI